MTSFENVASIIDEVSNPKKNDEILAAQTF